METMLLANKRGFETLSASGKCNEPTEPRHTHGGEDPSLFPIVPQGQFLKQAEQFEDDYNDNNYSDYVEDVSVHAVTNIRLGCDD